MIQRCLAKKAQQRMENGESSKLSKLDVKENGNVEEDPNLRLSDSSVSEWKVQKLRNRRGGKGMDARVKDGKAKEEDERPLLKTGPKVLPGCETLLNSKFQCGSFFES